MMLKNIFAGQQWRKRHREQTYGHRERGAEGEMYGESNMEFAVCFRELKQGLCINLRDGMGREMGGKLREREHMYTYG